MGASGVCFACYGGMYGRLMGYVMDVLIGVYIFGVVVHAFISGMYCEIGNDLNRLLQVVVLSVLWPVLVFVFIGKRCRKVQA